MTLFEHNYPFDPGYGYGLERLLTVDAPEPVEDFAEFWRRRYRNTVVVNPAMSLAFRGVHRGFKVYDLRYMSTDGFEIGGWLLEPASQTVRQCILVGHGYGGRDGPDYHFNIPETAFLFPCFRGLSRSRCVRVSSQPNAHVLHGIDKPERYILGGCVDDLWLAVSVILKLYPAAEDRIGYMGISFGGGIGALALPWDNRIYRAHLNVPTFGNQPLRLTLPTVGSGDSVRAYVQTHGSIPKTLAYYDAAVAARYALQPVHIAAALFDPFVAPPGQFAIYNAWSGEKRLFVLDAGHFDYPQADIQQQQLLRELRIFFD